MLPQLHEPLATVLQDKNPFGLLIPSPTMNAAPSCAANTCSTSCASHSSIFTAESSSRFAVAAGIAYRSIAGKDNSSNVGDAVWARASISPAHPTAGPAVIKGFL